MRIAKILTQLFPFLFVPVSLLSQNILIQLKKRALIETVNDELTNICQIEHSRHRSFENFLTNLLSGLIAYSFFQRTIP